MISQLLTSFSYIKYLPTLFRSLIHIMTSYKQQENDEALASYVNKDVQRRSQTLTVHVSLCNLLS